jgi:hypothetical protein
MAGVCECFSERKLTNNDNVCGCRNHNPLGGVIVGTFPVLGVRVKAPLTFGLVDTLLGRRREAIFPQSRSSVAGGKFWFFLVFVVYL